MELYGTKANKQRHKPYCFISSYSSDNLLLSSTPSNQHWYCLEQNKTCGQGSNNETDSPQDKQNFLRCQHRIFLRHPGGKRQVKPCNQENYRGQKQWSLNVIYLEHFFKAKENALLFHLRKSFLDSILLKNLLVTFPGFEWYKLLELRKPEAKTNRRFQRVWRGKEHFLHLISHPARLHLHQLLGFGSRETLTDLNRQELKFLKQQHPAFKFSKLKKHWKFSIWLCQLPQPVLLHIPEAPLFHQKISETWLAKHNMQHTPQHYSSVSISTLKKPCRLKQQSLKGSHSLSFLTSYLWESS